MLDSRKLRALSELAIIPTVLAELNDRPQSASSASQRSEAARHPGFDIVRQVVRAKALPPERLGTRVT